MAQKNLPALKVVGRHTKLVIDAIIQRMKKFLHNTALFNIVQKCLHALNLDGKHMKHVHVVIIPRMLKFQHAIHRRKPRKKITFLQSVLLTAVMIWLCIAKSAITKSHEKARRLANLIITWLISPPFNLLVPKKAGVPERRVRVVMQH